MYTMLQLMVAQVAGRLNAKSERGASAVEYGLLLAGIAVLITGAIFALGGRISGLFDGINFNG